MRMIVCKSLDFWHPFTNRKVWYLRVPLTDSRPRPQSRDMATAYGSCRSTRPSLVGPVLPTSSSCQPQLMGPHHLPGPSEQFSTLWFSQVLSHPLSSAKTGGRPQAPSGSSPSALWSAPGLSGPLEIGPSKM